MPDNSRTHLLPHNEEDDSTFERPSLLRRLNYRRSQGRKILSSHTKHYLIMTIVVLDVVSLLANIFLQLIACEMDQLDEPWVQDWKQRLSRAGLVFSCVFMAELLACFFSFGIRYFSTFFHVFDSTVIVLSLVIDIVTQGLTESIGSLVVVLRLWRLAKISEEVLMSAGERMEGLEHRLEELGEENSYLRQQLTSRRRADS